MGLIPMRSRGAVVGQMAVGARDLEAVVRAAVVRAAAATAAGARARAAVACARAHTMECTCWLLLAECVQGVCVQCIIRAWR